MTEEEEQEDKNKRIRPREQARGQKMTYVFFQRRKVWRIQSKLFPNEKSQNTNFAPFFEL